MNNRRLPRLALLGVLFSLGALSQTTTAPTVPLDQVPEPKPEPLPPRSRKFVHTPKKDRKK